MESSHAAAPHGAASAERDAYTTVRLRRMSRLLVPLKSVPSTSRLLVVGSWCTVHGVHGKGAAAIDLTGCSVETCCVPRHRILTNASYLHPPLLPLHVRRCHAAHPLHHSQGTMKAPLLAQLLPPPPPLRSLPPLLLLPLELLDPGEAPTPHPCGQRLRWVTDPYPPSPRPRSCTRP